MDNCMKQIVTLTGYNLSDIKQVLNEKIDSVDREDLKSSWKQLHEKIERAYNSPKFTNDYETAITNLQDELDVAKSLIRKIL